MRGVQEQPQEQSPWYRMPLVWMLILIPASAVIVGIIMMWLAISTDDGLVVDDYYRHGKTINKVLKRDTAASRYKLNAKLTLNVDERLVNIKLTARPDFNFPDELVIQFLNATRKGLDKKLILRRTDKGHYTVELPALHIGRWYVQIEAGDWRLLGSLSVPGETEFHISAIE